MDYRLQSSQESFQEKKPSITPPVKRAYSDLQSFSGEKDLNLSLFSAEKNKDFPRVIGRAVIKGYALRSFNVAHLKKGDELFLKRERRVLLEEKKRKKTTKPATKVSYNDHIIRILSQNMEVF